MIKSQESRIAIDFYVDLFTAHYRDLASGWIKYADQEHDLATFRRRVMQEGISFLTVTLPTLGKAVDRSLSSSTQFKIEGWKLQPQSELPRFLGGFLNCVFCPDGLERMSKRHVFEGAWASMEPGEYQELEDSRRALVALRQLCYLFYKLELPFKDEHVKKTLNEFIETDRQLPVRIALTNDALQLEFGTEARARHVYNVEDPELRLGMCFARYLVQRLLCNADPKSGIPRHGPGSVATGEKPVEKATFKRYYKALNAEFPYDQWFFYNANHLAEGLDGLQSLEELEAGTAKVVLVPKDSRGPRLISAEPLEYQWIQQSVRSVLYNHVESHWLTKGKVNFTDQSTNRQVALESSTISNGLWDDFITLDMKEASDRVSMALVEFLFPSNWVRTLRACRTPSTMLPDGRIVLMKKFAPMGSAVCFPVEAICFWALSLGAIIAREALSFRSGALPRTQAELTKVLRATRLGNWQNEARSVSDSPLVRAPISQVDLSDQTAKVNLASPLSAVLVYGDDILIHRENYAMVKRILEACSLRLNADKCCTGLSFRESCGMDAYLGVPVTPLRFRTVIHQRYVPNRAMLSLVAYANECWARGWYATAYWLESRIRDWFPLPIPVVRRADPAVVAFIRPDQTPTPGRHGKVRYNRHLHRAEFLGCRIVPALKRSQSHPYELMLREEFARPRVDVESDVGMYPLPNRDRFMFGWTPKV